MKFLKCLFPGLLLLLLFSNLSAQNRKYEFLLDKRDTLVKDIRIYLGLVHQHQDFFNEAYSFQGIEPGIIINHKLILGAYGSAFVSNLEVKLTNIPMFVNIWQSGLLVGVTRNDLKVIHSGWLLNIGYFALSGDDSHLGLFNAENASIKISGLVLSPQVYAEINITKWMKIRTGLAYSFYGFEDQSIITKSDLNNISFTFGFIFGKLK